jgi:hypothetical protein
MLFDNSSEVHDAMRLTLLIPLAAILFAINTPACDTEGSVDYSADQFQEYYPKIGAKVKLDGLELEKPIVVSSDQCRKATVIRTCGDKYGYQNQKCLITFAGKGLDKPRIVSVANFRTVDVSWITGKLVLIDVNIGHVASTQSIYDVEKSAWVYQESLQYYPDQAEPSTAPNATSPLR